MVEQLFNKILSIGRVCNKWKKSSVVPSYKNKFSVQEQVWINGRKAQWSLCIRTKEIIKTRKLWSCLMEPLSMAEMGPTKWLTNSYLKDKMHVQLAERQKAWQGLYGRCCRFQSCLAIVGEGDCCAFFLFFFFSL